MVMVAMIDVGKPVDVLLNAGPVSGPWVWNVFHFLGGGINLVECVIEDGGNGVVAVLKFILELVEGIGMLSALAIDWKMIDLVNHSFVRDNEGSGEAE